MIGVSRKRNIDAIKSCRILSQCATIFFYFVFFSSSSFLNSFVRTNCECVCTVHGVLLYSSLDVILKPVRLQFTDTFHFDCNLISSMHISMHATVSVQCPLCSVWTTLSLSPKTICIYHQYLFIYFSQMESMQSNSIAYCDCFCSRFELKIDVRRDSLFYLFSFLSFYRLFSLFVVSLSFLECKQKRKPIQIVLVFFHCFSFLQFATSLFRQ